MRGQQLGECRPWTRPEGGGQYENGESGCLHRTLELLDHDGTRLELLRGQDQLAIEPHFWKQEPLHPVAIFFRICEKQLRLRMCPSPRIDCRHGNRLKSCRSSRSAYSV